MQFRNTWLLIAALVVVAFVGTAAAGPIEPVQADRVCMVNNTSHPRPQIPIEVDGKTYFGCCEMCKDRLAADAAVRTAVDPVSGHSVDKATAVLGTTPQGKVVYFENQKNFDTYRNIP